MTDVLLATAAAMGFAIAGLASIAGLRIGPHVRAMSVAVAAGILITIAMVDLFPESLEVAGHRRAATAFLAGLLVLFAVESVTRGHGHHHHGGDHETDRHPFAPFVIGLGFHNFADGFAIGSSAELSHRAAVAVAIGVLVHQIPVGLSVSAVFAAGGVMRRRIVRSVVLLSLAIPFGAIVVVLLPDIGASTAGVLGGMSAGALIYIGAGHLLPEAQHEHPSWIVAMGFPITVCATALLFLSVLH